MGRQQTATDDLIVPSLDQSSPAKAPEVNKEAEIEAAAIVTEGVVGEVKGFFREMARPKGNFPHNHVNPQTVATNRLGRPKQFADASEEWPFAGCS